MFETNTAVNHHLNPLTEFRLWQSSSQAERFERQPRVMPGKSGMTRLLELPEFLLSQE